MGKGKLSLSSHLIKEGSEGELARRSTRTPRLKSFEASVKHLSMFVVLCAISQKMLKRLGMYPIMDLPGLLTTHLTTSVRMNGHKSGINLRLGEVWVWC